MSFSRSACHVYKEELRKPVECINTARSFEVLPKLMLRAVHAIGYRRIYFEKSSRFTPATGDDATRQEAFEAKWKAYRRIIDSESLMKATYYDYFAFYQALQKFQNLKCINVRSDGPGSHPAFHERFSTKDIYSELYTGADQPGDIRG